MKIDVSTIQRVFGDRILVKRLERPEKMGGLLIPQSYANEKRKEQSVWFGVIESFGLDSRYGEAYGLKEGDIIGISDVGSSNASFEGTDDHEHFWVMEEFIVLRDDGRVEAFRDDKHFDYLGLTPIGPYSIIKPSPDETKVGGVLLPKDKENLTGEVLAVSIGEVKNGELAALRVVSGSRVLFGRYSGLYARFRQETFLLIKEEDLIAELETAKEKELAHV
jgi:co-chaperonin GroES (HSP10)